MPPATDEREAAPIETPAGAPAGETPSEEGEVPQEPGEPLSEAPQDSHRPVEESSAPPAGLDEPAGHEAGSAPAAIPAPAGADPTAAGDWLDRICPYLLSEDGTWRSTQPDADHRCTAQDPPGTLPTAFQERYCLTERHVRCEMFKHVTGARAMALEQEGIPPDQVEGARFRPSVRSVPVALGPAGGDDGEGGGTSRGRIIAVAAAIGVVAILVFALAMILGGSDESEPEPGATAVATSEATTAPTATPRPEPTPTVEVTPASDATDGLDGPVAPSLFRYEVGEDELLLKIADKFGTTRKAIKEANEGMADKSPMVKPGDVILVPVARDAVLDEIAAQPGFVKFVEES
jgi:hypothetical protein